MLLKSSEELSSFEEVSKRSNVPSKLILSLLIIS